jgi:hypothetical protein
MNLFVWAILLRKNPIVIMMNESFALCCCHKVMPSYSFILRLRAVLS